MISSLKGKVGWMRGNQMEIEIGGVGYEVQLAMTNYELRIGDEVKLFVYMAASENDVRLFGFKTREDLDLFKMLITVSGVGPKTAAQILENSDSLAIIKAIGEAEVDFFKKIKGIGLKTAQRIIVDLKSKINKKELDMATFAGRFGELKEDDLVLSLRQLGFEKREIESVIQRLPKEKVKLEERLDWCLQNIK